VDDVRSKALDLLEERAGDAPSDEVGVERSAPRRGPVEPGHIADWARIRARQEAHESIVRTLFLVGRAKADDTNVVLAP
jgi:alpha-D-ribose 1-methylphosphonate 5-triphosphate diphosphatase PhnM